MTTSFDYGHPNYVTRRFQGPFTLAVGTANTSRGFVAPCDGVLHAAMFAVTTAGTSATLAKRTVRYAGTAIGTTTLGQSTAGVVATLDLAETEVTRGQLIDFLNGTDAEGTADVIVEWSPKPLATFQN